MIRSGMLVLALAAYGVMLQAQRSTVAQVWITEAGTASAVRVEASKVVVNEGKVLRRDRRSVSVAIPAKVTVTLDSGGAFLQAEGDSSLVSIQVTSGGSSEIHASARRIRVRLDAGHLDVSGVPPKA